MEKQFNYVTCCVDSDGESINGLVDAATVVTYRTMMLNCNGLLPWAKAHGYAKRGPGLTLRADWAVTFHKSKYRGKPCYYLQWSGIEYIWTKDKHVGNWGYGTQSQRRKQCQPRSHPKTHLVQPHSLGTTWVR